MIGPFAEAVRATTQPCTFLLVAPALVGVTAARARSSALLAALVASVVGGWLVAANWFVLDGVWLRLSAVAVLVALALIVLPSRGRLEAFGGEAVAASVAGGVALLATMWWRPCVGEELGEILTGAQTGLVGQLPGMTAYMLGAMVPVLAVVLAVRAIEPSCRVVALGARGAAGAGVVIAGALALGAHEDVVVTLTRWTLA